MSESRQELIHWVNSLLSLEITKVEQCGTGAVYCQLYDSIFRDVPMNKVSFAANTEYQYLNNLKILQNVFTQHGLERSVPVEALSKCKFQDNLEFLKWTKRFWDQNFPVNSPYDPHARRSGPGSMGGAGAGAGSGTGSGAGVGGSGANSRSSSRSSAATTSRNLSSLNARPTSAALRTRPPVSSRPSVSSSVAARRGPSPATSGGTNAGISSSKPLTSSTTNRPNNSAQIRRPPLGQGAIRVPSSSSSVSSGISASTNVASATVVKQLRQRVEELETTNEELMATSDELASSVELLQAERNFYYQKLYDIEQCLISDGQEQEQEQDPSVKEFVKEIQSILYETTDGFEIPLQQQSSSEGPEDEDMF